MQKQIGNKTEELPELPKKLPNAMKKPLKENSDDPKELQKLFGKHAWQPFTQMKLAPPPLFIERGSGARLFSMEGQGIIDAIGSWWVNIHGHAHPVLNRALQKQSEKIEHLIYAGLAHAPAVQLAQKLSKTTMDQLPRAFYSDNGSTAVEIALKMAYQYFWNQGQKRSEFITLGGGYHGDSFGAMSVGARGIFHEAFAPLLFDCHQLPMPSCPFDRLYDERQALEAVRSVLQTLEQLVEQRSSQICALILEPIIQGASAGFNIYPPILLKKIYGICKHAGILLIADEVFTGCGRTGLFYASQMAGIWPDIMALSKGLAAGYLPFAATLASERVYKGFYSDERKHTLFHGHSMTANPLGCALALSSLNLIEKDKTLEKVLLIEKWHQSLQQELKGKALYKKIKECRFLGSVGVIELQSKNSYTADFGWRIMQRALEEGVLIRPLGNAVYFTPPYCIEEGELEEVYRLTEKVLSKELGLSN